MIIIFTLSIKDPEGFGKKLIEKWLEWPLLRTVIANEESWSNTLLNDCTRMDRRWNKKAVSRSSPDCWLIFFARRLKKSQADWLIGLSFSTAIGSKWKLAVRAVYLFIFLTPACSATVLASRAADVTYESARGQTTVTSQTRDFLLFHWCLLDSPKVW